jgi:hypothetical protein
MFRQIILPGCQKKLNHSTLSAISFFLLKTFIYEKDRFVFRTCLYFFCCQKDLNSAPDPGPGSGCRMVRMTQGLNADDTIYTVKYDNKGRIAFIPDSLHGYIDTIHVAYDDKDRIVGVTAGHRIF